MTPRIRLFTTAWCGYCVRAKVLLDDLGYPYEEIRLDDDRAFRDTLAKVGAARTLPQILIDDMPIGGYAELAQLARSGRLVRRLEAGDHGP